MVWSSISLATCNNAASWDRADSICTGLTRPILVVPLSVNTEIRHGNAFAARRGAKVVAVQHAETQALDGEFKVSGSLVEWFRGSNIVVHGSPRQLLMILLAQLSDELQPWQLQAWAEAATKAHNICLARRCSMYKPMRVAVLMLLLTDAMAAIASGVNGINNGMPNRISMNVTVPKQTQGATFGEKVNAGLQSAGSALASGASLIIECGAAACVVALPDGSGYRAALESMTLAPLEATQGQTVRKAAAGAAMLGGALPGGSILSAAVSSVGNLAGGSGGGAAAASYAATGRSAAPRALASSTRADGSIDVTEPLAAGDYALTLVVAKANSGIKDTLQTQVRAAAPTRIRMRLIFSAADGALRARHDSSENSIAEMK